MGNCNAPFIPMAVLLLIGAALWFKIDASRELISDSADAVTQVRI